MISPKANKRMRGDGYDNYFISVSDNHVAYLELTRCYLSFKSQSSWGKKRETVVWRYQARKSYRKLVRRWAVVAALHGKCQFCWLSFDLRLDHSPVGAPFFGMLMQPQSILQLILPNVQWT